jgi:hypothetical protein
MSSPKLFVLGNPLLGIFPPSALNGRSLLTSARYPGHLVRACLRTHGRCSPWLIPNSDKSILKKYGLKDNDAILAEEKHMPIYEELITQYPAKFLAGGAAQNTARGAQVRFLIHI